MMAEVIALFPQTAILFKKNNTEQTNWTKRGYFLEGIIILSVPICVWGFLGNTIILWLLCYRIKRTRYTVYFLNLVIADLTVVLYYISAFILFLSPLFINLHILRVSESIYLLGYNASVYFLTALTFERYLTVFFPICWQSHRPKVFSNIAAALVWTLSCLVSILIYVACFPRFLSPSSAEISPCNYATLFQIIINCFIFFPIMLFCALSLYIKMKRKKQYHHARIDVTISLIVMLCLIFAFSVQIVDIIAFWVHTVDSPVTFLLSLLFDSIKSSINPLILFLVGCWRRRKIPETVHKFIERALKDREDGALRTHTRPRANLRVSWATELDRKGS